MRIVLFCHSLLSDWSHGNAHFLRGIVTEWQARGHSVTVYEARDAWSFRNLTRWHGITPLRRLQKFFPYLDCQQYQMEGFDVSAALAGADLVLVHEWNEPELVSVIGRHRKVIGGYRLLFHDTHHRAATAPDQMALYDLRHYDGVLAAGQVTRDLYVTHGWARRAWTWHEAADARLTGLFYEAEDPIPPSRGPRGQRLDRDVVWIGNWGETERADELREFLFEPVRSLRLRACVYGARIADSIQALLRSNGIEYGDWLPNYDVPAAFTRFKATVDIPRRASAAAVPGIPAIRVFEALACGIPLVCAPWHDTEGLFTPGVDFLVARDGREMTKQLKAVLNEPVLAESLSRRGRETILARHTCAHRADELDAILAEMDGAAGVAAASSAAAAA